MGANVPPRFHCPLTSLFVHSITAESLVKIHYQSLFMIFCGKLNAFYRFGIKPPNECKNWSAENKIPNHCGLASVLCQKQ